MIVESSLNGSYVASLTHGLDTQTKRMTLKDSRYLIPDVAVRCAQQRLSKIKTGRKAHKLID
jgi:hypothetical protein